ncbi:hypothetical protein [Microbacterium sp.]|uniref:hypothetical protein n=1 Tax=Microbacterium sp. TaxID=51671 RepID=UPI0039E2B301
MRVALHEVDKGRALPTVSLEFHTGAVRFAIAETEQRPTVLGLIASGRMRPDSGRVTIDGNKNDRMLRRRVALVDAPDVSDPHAGIALAGVVGEELMFAGVRATPLHARRWLSGLGYEELAGVAIGDIAPEVRVRILCELAVLREGVEGIVLVSPDRHGGSPDSWWRIAGEFAERGYAMLVVVGGAAAVALERMHELGAVNASGPIEPLVLDGDHTDGDDDGDDTAADALGTDTDADTDTADDTGGTAAAPDALGTDTASVRPASEVAGNDETNAGNPATSTGALGTATPDTATPDTQGADTLKADTLKADALKPDAPDVERDPETIPRSDVSTPEAEDAAETDTAPEAEPETPDDEKTTDDEETTGPTGNGELR